MATESPAAPTIHPTAIVDPQAELSSGVVVGPYAVIGPQVRVGPQTAVGAHCVLEGCTTIGADCQIFTGAVIGSIPQDLKYEGEKSELIIGDRNRIREYVTMNPGTKGGGGKTVIGSDCLLMAYAHVAHDCQVGDHVVIANSVALAGHILVEDRAIVGGLVGVHQFVRIGRLAMVGGNGSISKDIPPFCTTKSGHLNVIGGMNVIGMKRAGIPPEERVKIKDAFKLLYRSGLNVKQAVERMKPVCGSGLAKEFCQFVEQSKRGVCQMSNEADSADSE